jgi:hypothetical protein
VKNEDYGRRDHNGLHVVDSRPNGRTRVSIDEIEWTAAQVRQMEPGESLTVSGIILRDAPPFEHNGARWQPEEQVLEKIIGSVFEYSTSMDPMTRDVTFYRHPEPCPEGTYRWISPDRRHLVTLGLDGLYRPKGPR